MAASCSVEQTVAVDLGALLDAREGAVVTLVAGETRLAAHKAVLAARCPVFKALFRRSKASIDVVPICDVEGPVLRQLLAYLYNQQAPQLSPSLAPQLLAAAQKYRVLGLMNECEKQVAAQLSVETAAATAFLAVKCGCPRLEEAAISFIKAHTHQVMATKGWEDALRCEPEVSVQVTRLLSEPPAESSVPAAPDGRPTAGAQRQSQPHGRTPVAAVPPMPLQQTTPPVDDAVSRLQNLSAEEKAQKLIEAAKDGSVGDVEALLAVGADVGARDGKMYTALHWTASRGHVEAARCLLGARAEVDARDSLQGTPLHWAAQQGHAAEVRLLVASLANVDAKGDKQWTPLHFAARYGHAAVVRFLVASAADVDSRDEKNWTPLHRAAWYGHAAVVRILVASSADVDARDEDSWTPLHMAAYSGHLAAAAALLKSGADRGAKTQKGNTPLDLARKQKHQQLIDMLT